jgi:ketosteroid isomerase-like protein
MSEQANTKLIQEMYAAFGRGDVPTLLSAVSDDCVWETVGPAGKSPFFGVWKGRDGVGKFFQTIGTHLTFDLFVPREFIASGERVVVLGSDHARNKANGKGYQTDFVHVFTVRGGKVVAFREFFDSAAVAAAFA